MIKLLFILFFIQSALAMPVACKTKSVAKSVIAGVVSFFGVTLALLGFFVTALLGPDCKAGCTHGWVDCFMTGKLALTPFAFWATAALYAVDVWRVENRNRPWIVLGILYGAIVSDVFVAFYFFGSGPNSVGNFWHGFGFRDIFPLLIFVGFPLGMAAWYTIRAFQLVHAARLPAWHYFVSQLALVPFWIGSYFWSKSTYAALPDQSPCFVVTAASRGHAGFTGPHTEIVRHGRRLRANQQLLTFWELESRWQTHAPRSHATFRRIYNRLGPIIAARIHSPWLADAVYLALKPLEIVARCINGKD